MATAIDGTAVELLIVFLAFEAKTMQVAAAEPKEADYIDLSALSDAALNELMGAVQRANEAELGTGFVQGNRMVSFEDSSLPLATPGTAGIRAPDDRR